MRNPESRPNFLQRTIGVLMGKEKSRESSTRELGRGMVCISIENDPFRLGGSEIMWTKRGEAFRVCPLPEKSISSNSESEKIQDPAEIDMDSNLRDSIFVQGMFDSDSQGNVQYSSQRVKSSVFRVGKIPLNLNSRF